MNIELSESLTERGSLLYIKSEEGNIHIAWKMDDEEILVFEHCPLNYPSISLGSFPNKETYIQAITDVLWICKEYIIKCNDDVIRKFIEDNEE